MKKISTRNYRKHYILHLMPTINKSGESPYIACAEEAQMWSKWLKSLVKYLVDDPMIAKNINIRTEQLKKYGGVVASLQTVVLPLCKESMTNNLVYLDLNYAVNKEVQFFIGGIDVTKQVATSDKLTGLLTRFLRELYAGHENNFVGGTRDSFIEELFLLDDVDMVIDEQSRFRVQVDRSLRDYLVELNAKLRINA